MTADEITRETPAPFDAEELLRRYAAGERVFNEARLAAADLHGATLSGVDLVNANLTAANLENADLRDANLQGAILLRATLRNANLENTDLTKTVGLLPAQLAGANLSGVRLPDKFGDFDGLRVVEEESKNARGLYFATLLACFYGWLTIGTTTDAELLSNSASSSLPIIKADVPIVGVYILGPLVLLLLYIYLHLHLQRLWERLADLPAVFPDGRSLGKRAYPWLLTGLVYSYNPFLSNRRPPLSRLQATITVWVTWWLLPATILIFWLRYLRRHDWIGTSLHIVVVTVTVSAAILLYRLATATLAGRREAPLSIKQTLASGRSYRRAVWMSALAAAFTAFSWGAIRGIPPDFESMVDGGSLIGADVSPWDARRWVPRLLRQTGYNTFANLREVEISSRLSNWKGAGADEIHMVKRGQLRGADIRFADATRVFLVGADMTRANLQGIYFYNAALRHADLMWADLREAFLYEADLQHANLRNADLRAADLSRSNLAGASLKGARLDGTNFEEAVLTKTDLSGANLSAAKGLTLRQLEAAVVDAQTQLPNDLVNTKQAKRPTPADGGKR